MSQVPRGPKHLKCPLQQKRMSDVCHVCPLWVQLRGTNPNTGEVVDNWTCSLASLPMLLVENAKQSREAGAATESLRNELIASAQNTFAAAEAYGKLTQDRRLREIEAKQ